LSDDVGCPSVREVSTRNVTSAGSSIAVSWVALALAGVAAMMLWIADAVWYGVPSSGGPGISLLFIGGWVLLAWAALLAIGVVVFVLSSSSSRRGLRPLEFGLLAATIVLVAGILVMHPLAGSAFA
jgi:hypothetical protein